MANCGYGLGFQSIGSGQIDLINDTIMAQCIDSTHYTPTYATLGGVTYVATDQFLSDIPGASLVGSPQALSGKSMTLGVFNASTTTLPALTGPTVKFILLYKSTGVAGTSRLIALYDTGNNLPFTPIGGNVDIQWDPTAFHIFML